ncbi:hypothetical protein THAOC_23504, partial [Thalassiosira oceanica]
EEEPTSRQWNPESQKVSDGTFFDSFGVLGLGLDATEMDVKTAYRMLALQYHPDPDKNTRTALNELAWMDGFSRHTTGVL